MLKSFANFTLSGKLPAFTVVFGFLLFALAFPLSAVVSGAALVLITLHASPKNSILIVIASVLALAICSYLFINNAAIGAVTAIAQLIPSFILASVLYSTRSLSLSMQAAAILGAFAFIIASAMFPDTQQFWQSALTPIITPVLEAGGNSEEHIAQVISQTSEYMTGLLIASIVLVHSIILLFGYKLHSLANNTSQFDTDFREMRLGKVLAILALIAGIWAFLAKSAFATQLCGILIILFFIQGMAVIHTTCGAMTKGKLWLIITYFLVIFVPQAILIIILLGLIETFFKLRQHIKSNTNKLDN